MLRAVAAGAAAHGARGRESMLALKKAADGQLDLPIEGEAKIRAVCQSYGIDTDGKALNDLAGEVADILLEDLSRTVPAPHRTLQAFAPPERKEVWKALDILPVSVYHEVFESLHRTSTGTDGDWRHHEAVPENRRRLCMDQLSRQLHRDGLPVRAPGKA